MTHHQLVRHLRYSIKADWWKRKRVDQFASLLSRQFDLSVKFHLNSLLNHTVIRLAEL